ncbi:MAG: hypothetical protein EBR82_63975 [Caulobacteraceae bacterium]|nr:hypothetical protein [Caulobacteraceae bacterium]
MSSMAIFRSPSEMSNPIIGCERCGKNHAVDYPCEFIAGLERERDGAENESVEMARLLGMSGEREAALLARLDEANREIARLQMELDATCNAEELRQARTELDRLRAALVESEKDAETLQASNNTYERDWPQLVHEAGGANATSC